MVAISISRIVLVPVRRWIVVAVVVVIATTINSVVGIVRFSIYP